MTEQKKPKRNEPYSNRITVPFEKAVDILLSTQPKRKRAKKESKK